MAKTNNNRRFPIANHQPCHKAAERIGKAEARQELYDVLTIQQKLDRLPPPPAADKQRQKLLWQLATQSKPAKQ